MSADLEKLKSIRDTLASVLETIDAALEGSGDEEGMEEEGMGNPSQCEEEPVEEDSMEEDPSGQPFEPSEDKKKKKLIIIGMLKKKGLGK